ncbi:MAG: flagellar biosynthesis protein FliQ [Gemmatimonadota bacterium]
MSSTLAIELIRRSLMLCLLVGAPMLLAAMVIGLVVSLLQAVTQIQEQTLTFIPKLLVVGIVMMLAMPWILNQLVQFMVSIFRSLPGLAG